MCKGSGVDWMRWDERWLTWAFTIGMSWRSSIACGTDVLRTVPHGMALKSAFSTQWAQGGEEDSSVVRDMGTCPISNCCVDWKVIEALVAGGGVSNDFCFNGVAVIGDNLG